MKILTFANLLSRWNSHPHSRLISWPAFHYCSVGETSSLPFVPLKDNVTFCAYPNSCQSAEATHQSQGWLAGITWCHSTAPGHGLRVPSQALAAFSSLHHGRWVSLTCFESLADKETRTGAREKHPPPFLRGHGQAGGSPHTG